MTSAGVSRHAYPRRGDSTLSSLLAQDGYRVVGSGSATPVILLHGELDSLRSRLGYDRVHIVGHSWGTILGFE